VNGSIQAPWALSDWAMRSTACTSSSTRTVSAARGCRRFASTPGHRKASSGNRFTIAL
jgi:hypothetical protein